MNLLNKNINDITFDQVVDFCKEKVPEGVQLDYKLTIPRDLSKHFATFSNTQGGLIIVGVGEDAKGLPTTYDGVTNDGKLIDQVHQHAANAIPLPSYEVCITDEKAGKVFILIRIHEGRATPYCTVHDPTPWIRTGNISTPLRAANREELLNLIGRRDEAKVMREANYDFSQRYFESALKQAEQERLNQIKAGESETYAHSLTDENLTAVFTVTLQPYYPKKQMIAPTELSNRLPDLLGKQYFNTALSRVEPVSLPGGVSGFTWSNLTGSFTNSQLFGNGMSFHASDAIQANNNTPRLYVGSMATQVARQLKLIQEYYSNLGYSGLIDGTVRLRCKEGVTVEALTAQGNWIHMPEPGRVMMPDYTFKIELDTNTLKDDASLEVVVKQVAQDLSWGLGAGEIPANILEAWVQQSGAMK